MGTILTQFPSKYDHLDPKGLKVEKAVWGCKLSVVTNGKKNNNRIVLFDKEIKCPVLNQCKMGKDADAISLFSEISHKFLQRLCHTKHVAINAKQLKCPRLSLTFSDHKLATLFEYPR